VRCEYGVDTVGIDRATLVGAIQGMLRQDDTDAARRVANQSIGAVLHQLIDLATTVPTLRRRSFYVGVLPDEERVDGVRL
jgi:hypothetical protein